MQIPMRNFNFDYFCFERQTIQSKTADTERKRVRIGVRVGDVGGENTLSLRFTDFSNPISKY